MRSFGDIRVELGNDFVASVEIDRGPDNYFDRKLIASLAEALEALDSEHDVRAIVLCSAGKHFCAGANFRSRVLETESGRHLYDEAARLFRTRKPVVAAIQGGAIGGGLGLALVADFRVAAPEARFAANFARLGFHHGFGLSVTLPALIGEQRALELLYTGRRVPGEEALRLGLCDRLAPLAEVRGYARSLALEIAASGPLAVEAIRSTQRGDLADRVVRAMARERAEQDRLRDTDDFHEGIAAMAARRAPSFQRR